MLLQWLLLRTGIKFAPENDEGATEETEGEESAEEETEGEESAEEETEGEESAEEEIEGEESAGKPSRGESRYQKLANESRMERERRIALEAENRVLKESRAAAPADSGEAARVRAEKLALMEPAERAAFLAGEKADKLEQQIQLQNLRMADIDDRSAYNAKAMTSPVYAKHKDWVENALKEARQAGNNPTREALLRWKIGEDALNAKPGRAAKAAKQAAGQRVASSQGTGTSSRGDVGGSGSRKNPNDMTTAELKARILERERVGAVN